MSIKRWGREDVQRLLDLKKLNLPLKEIGGCLGVSSNAISKALGRYCSAYLPMKDIEKHIKEKQKNSLLEAIYWFNHNNTHLKIKKFKDGFLCGGEYCSAISTIIILNRFRLHYEKPLIDYVYHKSNNCISFC